MEIGLVMAALISTAHGAECSWANPGANPFRGDPVAALADFQMPDKTRRQLRAIMAAHRYTDVVTITRTEIAGHLRYEDLRDMHSGHGRTCHGKVDRSSWGDGLQERGLVYCVDDTCVIVPTVCNNISLVTRTRAAAAEEDVPIVIFPAAGPPLAAGEPDSGPRADAAGAESPSMLEGDDAALSRGPIDVAGDFVGGFCCGVGAGGASTTGGGGDIDLPGGVLEPGAPSGSNPGEAAAPIPLPPTSAVSELPASGLTLAGLAFWLIVRACRYPRRGPSGR